MKRDFLLELSSGFIYDSLEWGLARLNHAEQRRLARKHFSGYLCVDELHLGDYTLLLATDPIADRVIGYSLVKINDQAHLRRFLRLLQYWGFEPKVVVTDGSNLYPTVLASLFKCAAECQGKRDTGGDGFAFACEIATELKSARNSSTPPT